MKILRGSLLLGLSTTLVLAVIALPAMASDGTGKQKADFSYKPQQKWTILLPKEQFTPVAGKIAIPHVGGDGFVTAIDGTALAVDANGDGKVDVKAKGAAGWVKLRSKDAQGNNLTYAVRLVNEGGWKFASSGIMVGKINGVPVTLIDQNNNGAYNDFGQDAMIVGKSDSASFLSKVVNVKGELFELEVAADGTSVSYAPFTGQSGMLNLNEGFACNGKLESIVVTGNGGEYSFELSSEKKGLRVPAGSYDLAWGLLSKGSETVNIRSGKMASITVGSDQEQVVAWGGPLEAVFDYTHEGDTLTIRPQDLWFFGKAGEEYFQWVPDGQPPEFIVTNAKNNQKITTARFGGC